MEDCLAEKEVPQTSKNDKEAPGLRGMGMFPFKEVQISIEKAELNLLHLQIKAPPSPFYDRKGVSLPFHLRIHTPF